jgi:hypothetical protein
LQSEEKTVRKTNINHQKAKKQKKKKKLKKKKKIDEKRATAEGDYLKIN